MTILLRAGAAVVAIGACVSSALAQQPTRLPGTYITGQVLSANGNTPLRRVRIDVARGTWKGEPVLSDNDGRFSIDLERAGPLSVTATKGGYLIASTTVKQEDISRPLLISLLRGAVITGTAIDEKGQPAMSAQVQAKRLDAAVDGFRSQAETSTDDRGEYRLAGLAPGRYELIAGQIITSFSTLPPTDPGITIVVASGDQIGGVQLTVPESRTIDGYQRRLEAAARKENPALSAISRTPPARPSAGSGGIRGRVMNDARKPIVDTTVRLSGAGIIQSVKTDASGAFSIVGLRPGRYTLEASRVTVLGMWGYGQDDTSSGPTPIVVTDHIEEGLDIILPRSLALQGVVVDEHGEPVQGARVQAFQVEYSPGRLLAVPAGSERRTDDQGSYRLWGLTPGTYLLSASLDGTFRDGRGTQVNYTPVYYPGTPVVAAASPIELRDDSTINLVLAPVALTQIAGKAHDGEGPLVAGTVRLVESRRPGQISMAPRSALIQPDGSFILRNVPPGDYVLHVRGDGPGRTGLFATQAVSVGSDPINLQVRTSHGMSLEGRSVFEGPPGRVECYATPQITVVINSSSSGAACDTRQSVSFNVVPVALDDHARSEATIVFGWTTNEFFGLGLFGRLSFALQKPPDENWYLKSFTINGTDIADSGFDFGTAPGTLSGAEIVLSHNGASVSGRRADKGPNTGYYAIVFPASRTNGVPPASRRVKFARSASDGSFRINGLPAGDYLVAAVSRLQAGEWQNPELWDLLAPRAERVTLTEGQNATVSVRLLER